MQINGKEFEVFIPEDEIAGIITRLSASINKDFADKNPCFIVMLNGAFMFAADLLRKITVSNEVVFVRYSSYDGMQTSGKIKKHASIPEKIKNRPVVILEDIIDTGITMDFFLSELKNYHPESVSVVSFLLKPEALQKNVHIDYVGKEIENRFVVGYGLDYDGFGRNLSAVYVVK